MGKTIAKFFAAVGVVLVLLGILAAGGWYLHREYVFWNGSLLSRSSRELNIAGSSMTEMEVFLEFPELKVLDARNTGMTLQQYEWLRQKLPRCRILWDIPIQGAYYPQDTRELKVDALTAEEINALQYIEALSLIDLGDWENDSQIRLLRERYPHCELRYRTMVAQEWWDSDMVSLILTDADAREVASKLDLFPDVKSVLLVGRIPDREALTWLQEQYPGISFLWIVDTLGMSLESELTELDLTGVSLESGDVLAQLLPFFPVLERVELGDNNLSAEELVALTEAYPDIRFLGEVTIGGRSFRTDAREIDLSNLPLETVEPVESVLPCFPELEKVVMCECGISNEEMDALNRRHEDIRFVWSVDLGGVLFRTDAIHFAPNRWGLKLSNEDVYPLRYCTDMLCVDIGHQMGVTNCEWAAFMPELKYLILAETGISDLTPLAGLKKLIYLELFLMPVRDLSPLVSCTALEDLNLCYTQADPTPVGEMIWLKRLWWTGMWTARVTLPEKLGEHTYMEFLSPSSTGKGWREGQNYYDMRDLIGMKYMTG